MRVAIASDHAGVVLQTPTVEAVRAAGHDAVIVGEPAEGDDYPDIALAVARAIREGRAERGVVLCGSGAGVTVAANKIPLVRAALAHDTYTAQQMVEHDAVNVIALGARVIGPAIAGEVVTAFTTAVFSGVERHARRLGKVIDLEASRIAGVPRALRLRGQRLWVTGVQGAALRDARVARWIGDHGVSGVVTHVGTLADDVRDDPAYAERLLDYVDAGVTAPDELITTLQLDDLVPVAELLGALHAARRGADGHAVVQLPPEQHDDLPGTVAMAQRLRGDAGRPNIMVDVPATRAGLGAVTRLVAQGVPVHISMLFSAEHYRAAAEAYLAGVEERLAAGDPLGVGAVLAVEVALWDSATAERLPVALRDTVGLAIAHAVAEEQRALLSSERWSRLADAGALLPRLLFSATTADPQLPATWYVGRITDAGVTLLLDAKALEATIEAHQLDEADDDDEQAADTLGRVAEAGITLDVLATRLRHDALRRRAADWAGLVEAVRRVTGDEAYAASDAG
jgi:RpiB/LacA/LacB family sugar-phosphate isomerase